MEACSGLGCGVMAGTPRQGAEQRVAVYHCAAQAADRGLGDDSGSPSLGTHSSMGSAETGVCPRGGADRAWRRQRAGCTHGRVCSREHTPAGGEPVSVTLVFPWRSRQLGGGGRTASLCAFLLLVFWAMGTCLLPVL